MKDLIFSIPVKLANEGDLVSGRNNDTAELEAHNELNPAPSLPLTAYGYIVLPLTWIM